MNTRCLMALILSLSYTPFIHAISIEYGSTLCKTSGYICKKIKANDSWSQLFPDKTQRDLLKQLNRMNGFLQSGMTIAIPVDLKNSTDESLSPLPLKMEMIHEKTIMINQKKQAWGAYDRNGKLIRWGAISSGSKRCFESPVGCLTPNGIFRILQKRGKDCKSSSFPQRIDGHIGGAPMPYCMFFMPGYAIHGSNNLPGYPNSHGCIRMFVEDAKWLYDHFTETSSKASLGTKVIIDPFE